MTAYFIFILLAGSCTMAAIWNLKLGLGEQAHGTTGGKERAPRIASGIVLAVVGLVLWVVVVAWQHPFPDKLFDGPDTKEDTEAKLEVLRRLQESRE